MGVGTSGAGKEAIKGERRKQGKKTTHTHTHAHGASRLRGGGALSRGVDAPARLSARTAGLNSHLRFSCGHARRIARDAKKKDNINIYIYIEEKEKREKRIEETMEKSHEERERGKGGKKKERNSERVWGVLKEGGSVAAQTC